MAGNPHPLSAPLLSLPQDTWGREIGGRLQPRSLACIPLPSLSCSVPWGSEKEPAPEKCLGTKNKGGGGCRLPAPTRVPLPMLCPLPWTCYVYPVPPPSDSHLCTVPSSPTAPLPPSSLIHPIVVQQRQGPGCAVATSSSFLPPDLLGGEQGRESKPQIAPYPPQLLTWHGCQRWEMLVWLGKPLPHPTVITGCFRGSGASCNNSLVSRGLWVIMG